MFDYSNSDLPAKAAKAAKKDADFDRRVRVGIAALPLAQRQTWAEGVSK
jgi:hypothetical protein